MNSNIKISFVFVCLAIILSCCTQNIDIPYPDYVEKIVLTGVIQPDSIIKIRLEKTLPYPADDSLPAITNARVVCYENGKLLGPLKPDNRGGYAIAYFPKEKNAYKIEATYNGQIVTAEDTIPTHSNIAITMGQNNANNSNNNPDLFLKTERKSISYNWISAIISSKWNGKPDVNSAVIVSSAPIFDTFNAYKQPNGGTSYDKFARIKPEILEKISIQFSVNSQVSVVKEKGDMFFFTVSSVSLNYDKYLKSSLLAFQNRVVDSEGTINNPFATPLPVYSNIKGGIGFFGAMQTERTILKKIE